MAHECYSVTEVRVALIVLSVGMIVALARRGLLIITPSQVFVTHRSRVFRFVVYLGAIKARTEPPEHPAGDMLLSCSEGEARALEKAGGIKREENIPCGAAEGSHDTLHLPESVTCALDCRVMPPLSGPHADTSTHRTYQATI